MAGNSLQAQTGNATPYRPQHLKSVRTIHHLRNASNTDLNN